MHEAGHVAADEDVGLRFKDVVKFQRTHATGNVREGDGKRAAETATLFGLAKGSDGGVFNRFQQRERGFTAAGATAVAGAVKSDAGRFVEFPGPGFDAKTVINEVHDFPGAAGEGVDGFVWIFLKLEGVSVEVHGRAGAGGDDHGQVAGEDFGAMFRDFTRGGPIAGVKGRLAAAGLVFGEFDGDAEVFEDFDRGLGGIIIEGIAEACPHQEDAFVGRALEVAGHEK